MDSKPRTSVQLLKSYDFGAVFWGKGGNLVAFWAFTVIVVAVTYNYTGSPAWTGAVSAAQMVPPLFLTLLSGRLSDSYGERWLIVSGGFLSALACFVLALWLWLAGTDAPAAITALLVCSFVAGCGNALSAPAQQSIVTRLVQPEELSAAVSLNFLPTALARTLGPAGGALLLSAVGPALGVLILGLVLGLTALAVHLAGLPGPGAGAGSDARILAAFRYVLTDRIILASLLAVAALGAGSEPAITLAPAIADAAGRADATGIIVAAFGAGGAAGVLVHRLARAAMAPVTEGIAAIGVLAGMVLLMGWVRPFEVMLAVMFAAGCSMVVGVTGVSIAIQQRCLPALLGRVMAMWVLAFTAIRPVAALSLGYLADRFALPVALLSMSSVLILAAAVVLLLAIRGQRDEAVAA